METYKQIDYLSLLPKELKIALLFYLNPNELCNLSLMSHSWYKLINEELIWKNICIKSKLNISDETIFDSKSCSIELANYLSSINSYKRTYLIDYNIKKNWTSRKICNPIILRKHDEVISCLKFNDKFKILIGSYYLRLELWCLTTGKLVQTFIGHTDIIWACQLIENRAVSASADQTVRVWNLTTGECIFILNGHSSTVRCLSAIFDNQIISGSSDNTIRIWNIETGICLNVLEGHTRTVSCVCIAEKYYISGSYDHTVRIWDKSSMKCLHILKDHENRVFSLLFNGEHIISASLDSNKILIWNVETGNLIHKLTGFNSLQMRLSNHTLVTSSTESNLKIWSLNRDKCLLNYNMINNNNNSSIIKEENSICCFEFNQDFLVSYSLDGFIKLWSMKTFKFIRNLLKVNGGAVWELCIYKTKLFCVLVSPTLCSFGETKLISLDFDWPNNNSNDLENCCPEIKP